MANQKSSQDKQQYFIPFEVTTSTIIPDEYKDQPLKCLQIGIRKFQGLLIPVSKKVYQEYMRPEWKDDKRKQRQAENRRKREKAQETGTKDKTIKPWDTAVSYERLREKGFEFGAGYEIEDGFFKKELIKKLRELLAALEKMDRIIMQMVAEGYPEAEIAKIVGLSQKGVNKRKHKILDTLRVQLQDYC